MIRYAVCFMSAAAVLSWCPLGCALDADGSGEVAQTAGGGGMTGLADAASDVPSFATEDANAGPAPVAIAPAGTSTPSDDASVSIDSAAPTPTGPPKPGSDDQKKDGGKN